MSAKIKVAVVGLGFGAEFIPIYQRHPEAECWAICQRTEERLNEIGDEFGVERRYTKFEDLLKEDELDAVHINTPIAAHAPMSLAAPDAGKHTACTVPMATTTEECLQIVEAQRRSGKVYMMMETAVYTREFLYAQELVDSGKLGKIQFLRGSHPHLVHEFVRAIIEERPSVADADRAANWTMTGICAHDSAMQGGERVEIPVVEERQAA